jgi:hypothetical protein
MLFESPEFKFVVNPGDRVKLGQMIGYANEDFHSGIDNKQLK